MLTSRTLASDQPTDTLPVLAAYLHTRPGTTPPRPLEAISFDVDDTLIDTTSNMAHGVRAGAMLAATLTSRVDPGTLIDAYQTAFDAHWRHPAAAGTGGVQDVRRRVWRTALRSVGVTLDTSDLDRLVYTCVTAQLAQITPDPELRGLLRELTDLVPVAVCSNGPRASVQQKLDKAALTEFVTAIICGPDSGLAKPDPGPFHACSRALNVDPARCLHIGDRWHADVEGALAAGKVPIWISRHPAANRPRPPTEPWYPTVTHAIRDLLRLLSATTRQARPADLGPAAETDHSFATSGQTNAEETAMTPLDAESPHRHPDTSWCPPLLVALAAITIATTAVIACPVRTGGHHLGAEPTAIPASRSNVPGRDPDPAVAAAPYLTELADTPRAAADANGSPNATPARRAGRTGAAVELRRARDILIIDRPGRVVTDETTDLASPPGLNKEARRQRSYALIIDRSQGPAIGAAQVTR
ncbi:HAD-IA family hydrolase [Micromonospora haikouensis]|uniref:HAD family hydrolase n=1 Tax=Micromonospora haikouensis TaxID=686309 RepID=UPI003D743677